MSGNPPIKIFPDDQFFIDNCLAAIPKRMHKGLMERYAVLSPHDRQGANLILLNAREEQEKIAQVQAKYLTLKPANE